MKRNHFGKELILDLTDCDPKVIRSKRKLDEYIDSLCKIINMKKFGKPFIIHFGLGSPHTKGFSLLQFIETSSITGHFSELWNSAYINIFSCGPFNTKRAANFTKEFFKAKGVENRVVVRG